MKRLFLSYSRSSRDKILSARDRLERLGVATFFDETDLAVGLPWPQALEQALQESRAVAVFVSAEISYWQWREIGFALDRQRVDAAFPVIPVLLDGAERTQSFLFTNNWVDMRGELFDDARSIERLLSAVSHPTTRIEAAEVLNPFRGLSHFDETHEPFYFGREAKVDEIFQRVTGSKGRFVAVVGPSGNGKSSVIRAGLIPRLRRQRPPMQTWDTIVFYPGDRPWLRLADAIAPLRFPEKEGIDVDIEVDKLSRALEGGAVDLSSLLDKIKSKQGPHHRVLVFVDQFEELFTLAPPRQRDAFIQALVNMTHRVGSTLVITLRSDFYGQAIDAHPDLGDLLQSEQVTLGKLTESQLRRAVTEPIKKANLTADPGLVDLLMQDATGEPGSLPLLQHALHELFLRRFGPRLTVESYFQIGGIRRAVATTAEQEFAQLDDKNQILVRRIFTRLVRLSPTGEGHDTRVRVPVRIFPEQCRWIIQEFSSSRLRLLVIGSAQSARRSNPQSSVNEEDLDTVEVAHEALIREWTRLRDWLNEDREFYLWRQRLSQDLADFVRHNRDPAFLLSEGRVHEAERRIASPIPEPLGEDEAAFVDESSQKQRAAYESQLRLLDRVKMEADERLIAQGEKKRIADQWKQSRSLIEERQATLALLAGVLVLVGIVVAEPPRDLRRLQLLRRWSHEQV